MKSHELNIRPRTITQIWAAFAIIVATVTASVSIRGSEPDPPAPKLSPRVQQIFEQRLAELEKRRDH